MTRGQAQFEAKKRWGSRGTVRASETLSSPEKRETQAVKNGTKTARIPGRSRHDINASQNV